MKLLACSEWLERNPDLATEDDCPECDGEGTHECSCGHVHNCSTCDGTGRVRNLAARQLYQTQRARDRAALEQLTGE